MRFIGLFFAFVFLWFAYLQLNDADPIWWATLYLIPAYVSIMFFLQKNNRELLIVLGILYAAYAINSWLQITKWEGFFTENSGMEMKSINQELAREAVGLLICVLTYMAFLLFSFFGKTKLSKN